MGVINFIGHGANVVGSLGSGSLVQDMPTACQFPSATYAQVVSGASTSWDYLDGAATCSWSIWFKSSDDDNGRLFDKFNGWTDGNVFYSRIDSGALQGVIATDATAVTSQVPSGSWFVADTWQNWMVTYDGANVKGYLNGVLKDTDALTGALESGGTDQEPLNIAAFRGGSQDWDGELRDFRIWTSGLTATEVAEVSSDVNMTGGTATGSLVGWWKMEEGTGTTLTDSSTKTNNAIITGTTGWNKSAYNLNQIGVGSVSGTAIVSGGTWNLRDSTYLTLPGVGGGGYIGGLNPFESTFQDSFSFSCWTKLDDGQGVIYAWMGTDTASPASNGASLYYYGDRLSLFYGVTGTQKVAEAAVGSAGTFPNGQTDWIHLVGTAESGGSMKLYVNGAEIALDPSNNGDISALTMANYANSSNNLVLGAKSTDGSISRNVDGEIKDCRLYDSSLTAAQVDLLYKGQWVGSPVGWWKLNEGTGVIATDSGTGADNGTITAGTWVNPNYDISNVGAAADEGLTITSGTTLSAPRGELLLRAASPAGDPPDWRINGKYIHNSGTLTFSGTTDTDWYPANEADNTNAYYKVKQAGTKPQWHNGSWTVEHSINLQGNIRAYANSSHANGHILTLGTTGSVGYITGSAYIQAMTNTNGGSLIKSASENYPAVLSGTHASYGAIVSPYRSIQVSGVHMFGDCKTGNNGFENGSTLKILGNTVWGDKSGGGAEIMIPLTDSASNDTGQNLDVSGAAVHIKIPMYISGNMIVKDAAVFANKFMQSANRSFVHNDNSKIIYSHQTANNDNFIMPSISGQQMMNSNYRQFTNAAYDIEGDLIVGRTNTTGFRLNHNFNCRNIYVGDDANSVFDQNDKTLTVSGTKLSAVGGFIGACQGMFANDPTTTPTQYITYASGQTIGSAMTMEAWVNTSDTNDQIFLKLHDPYTYLKVESDGKIYGRIGTNGTTSELNSTTLCDDGKWHHVALSFKQGEGGSKLYVDGILESQVEGDTGSPYTPNTFSIGADHSDMQKGLNGSLARVSVWKDNLSQAEILQMMFMDYLSVSSSAIDHTQCINWTQFDGKSANTEVYNLAAGSNNGTASTSDIWDVPNGYANWIKGTGSTAQLYLTSPLDIDVWGKNWRIGNVSGGATSGKKMKITRWDGYEQTIMFYGAWKWGPGTLEQKNYSTYGDNATPWCTANGNLAYVEEISGTPFGDASNGLAAYWNSNYPTKPMTIKNMLPTDNVNLGGDFTIVGTMMPSLTSKSQFIDSHGYDMMLKQWKSYNGTIGELRLGAGSTLYFVNDNSGFSEGVSDRSLIQIVASGEAAVQFYGDDNDGYGNYITLPKTSALDFGNSAFTMTYWAKFGDGADEEYIISNMNQPDSSWPGFRFGIKNGVDINNQINDNTGGGAEKRFDTNMSAGVWKHIAIVVSGSGGDMLCYVDGSLPVAGQNLGTYASLNNDKTVKIGGAYAGDTQSFNGSISDVRFYKSALSAANIGTLYSGTALSPALNPATDVSGAYADPDNDLSATVWLKLGATTSGTMDLKNYGTSGSANDGTWVTSGSPPRLGKTGFTRILPSGTTNAWEFNIGTGDKMLQNFYLSGSSGDILVSNSGTANAAGAQYPGSLTTKGTVVFD